MSKHSTKQVGFTLLEVLIALFIFTIVSMIMMSALHNIINTQTAAEKKSDRFAELEIALLILSRDVEQTIDRPISIGSTVRASLVGDEQSVEFTHAGLQNPLGQLARSTLQRTRYEIRNHRLIRMTWPILDRTDDTQADLRILLTGVSHLQIDYLDHKGHLQRDWPLTTEKSLSPPRAVRISFIVDNWGKITQFYFIPGQPLEKPH